jgi:hypothetical protein
MSDGKKAAYEDAQEEIWKQRVKIAQNTTPAEFLKIFDDIRQELNGLNAAELYLTWKQHTRFQSIKALIQKLP